MHLFGKSFDPYDFQVNHPHIYRLPDIGVFLVVFLCLHLSSPLAPTVHLLWDSLVELHHVDLDVAKVGPLGGVLGPAAIHQYSKLLGVEGVVSAGPEVGLLAVTHFLNNLCH